MLNLIADNQAGIPLHMEALNGNSSDKAVFKETIATYVGQLQNATGFTYLVSDSAGYTQQAIAAYSEQVKWISRVPETLSACQHLIASSRPLQPLLAGYHYRSIYTEQAGVKQRWLVIFSPEAYQREIKTLQKTYHKQSIREYKALLKLSKRPFACQQDATRALKAFTQKCHYLQVDRLPDERKPYYSGRGRPALDQQPAGYHYYIQAQLCCSLQHYHQLAQRKGRFVIATNQLDEQALSDVEVLLGYKGAS